jgi:phospholipase/carboxylesterase
MSAALLETVVIDAAPEPEATIIWLHGLGADGHDFEPVVPQLQAAVTHPLRFIFPHAPVRPVSLNGGMPMRAWYDLLGLDRHSAQDERGLADSAGRVSALIERESARGIAAGRVVIAGFSQGGALSLYLGARYGQTLAGIVALSCYLPVDWALGAEAVAANRQTPIFMAHGSHDAVIDESMGRQSCAVLQAHGYPVEWHSYPMGHTVCEQEITAIAAFLQRVLAFPTRVP